MLRKTNQDILDRAVLRHFPVFAIQIAKAGTITECMVFAHMEAGSDNNHFRVAIFSGEVFDSEDIVLDENPIRIFTEYASESDILSYDTMNAEDSIETILKECRLDADDYNALECSEHDLSEIIDWLRDGLYIISFNAE